MFQVYLTLALRVAGISDEIMTDKQYLCKTLLHGHFWMLETKFFLCFNGKTYPRKLQSMADFTNVILCRYIMPRQYFHLSNFGPFAVAKLPASGVSR